MLILRGHITCSCSAGPLCVETASLCALRAASAVHTDSVQRSSYIKKTCLCFLSWGRWEDIIYHGHFKRHLQVHDVKTIARGMVSWALLGWVPMPTWALFAKNEARLSECRVRVYTCPLFCSGSGNKSSDEYSIDKHMS